jgi:sulfatase maturation enzyme AslB (radical SAM superfamily)
MHDREKVIKTLTDALSAKENYPWAKAEMSFEFIEMLLELLKEQEAVVRCKDCKHYRATPGYCAYDRIWQENKGHVWGMYCKPDWFCADGKHK